jgi:MFS family permease
MVLGLVSLLTDISSEMTLTILPLFLANVLGVKTSVIGLIEGVAETTASLTKIFSGWISDRLGQRKAPILLGYSLSAVAKPLLYFAGTWELVAGIRFVDRLGKGIRTSPRDALIADSSDPERRGLSFGFHRAGDTAGAFIGLSLAALVVYLSQRTSLALTRPTYQMLVLIGVIPGLLAVLLLWLFVREPGQPSLTPTLSQGEREQSPLTPTLSQGERERPSLTPTLSQGERVQPPSPQPSPRERGSLLRGFDRRFKLFLVVIILFTLGNSSDAFLVLRAQSVGLSVLQVFLLLVTFNLVYTLIATPAGALSDRLGRRGLLVVAWTLYGLVYLGFALAGAGWQVWALYAIYGVYYGMGEGVGKALVADVVQPGQRGTAYGIYNAAVGVTAFPASLIAGLLWQGVGTWPGFGPAAPFLFGAAMALLAVGLLVVWLPAGR